MRDQKGGKRAGKGREDGECSKAQTFNKHTPDIGMAKKGNE